MTALIDAIKQRVPDERVRLAMVMGALLETGRLDPPWGVGDQGRSYGPFQINTAANPVNPNDAQDVNKAVQYMSGRYQTCAGGQDWADPMTAAFNTVVCAERPDTRQGYAAAGAGSEQAHQAYTLASTALDGFFPKDGNIVTQITGAAGNVAGKIGGAVLSASPAGMLAGAIGNIIPGLFSRDAAIRVLLVVGGAFLCVVGVAAFVMNSDSGRQAASTAALAAA